MLLLSGKIPVYVHPFFWLLALLIGWLNTMNITGTLVWVVVILFSVLVHEFGHALTAVYFGQRAKIQLMAFGGATYRSGGKLKLWQEFLIVLNGPLFGLLLFAAAFMFKNSFVTNQINLFVYALHITIFVNLFWTIVNLLPIQPLDGGHLLRIILEGVFGFRGVKIAFFISMLLAAGFAILSMIMKMLLLGMIFLLFAVESYRMWKSTLELTEQDQDLGLRELLKQGEQDFTRGDLQLAAEKFSRILELSPSGVLHDTASEFLGKILYRLGNEKGTYDLLIPIKKKLSPETLKTLHKVAFNLGKWSETIELGNRTFQNDPNYETALINARTYAINGDSKPACGWLQSAIKEGLPNVSEVLQYKEFDNIRDSKEFQKLYF